VSLEEYLAYTTEETEKVKVEELQRNMAAYKKVSVPLPVK